jgi:hypothetical protein
MPAAEIPALMHIADRRCGQVDTTLIFALALPEEEREKTRIGSQFSEAL